MSSPDGFSDQDRALLAARGVSLEEAERQLALMARVRRFAPVERPCTRGDGILCIADADRDALLARFERAAAEGRISQFVPASGAASRMFQALAAELGAGEAGEATERLAAALEKLPFGAELRAAAGGSDDALALAGALLGEPGLSLAARPKGLIPFHRAGGDQRTAFEEQLVGSAPYLRDAEGRCRIHLTVSPEHEAGFTALLEARRAALEARCGVRFDVSFSFQSPATDTLAGAVEGGPFRDESGALLFRAGGHGALLHNLADLDGDVVVIKNIDNVLPADRQDAVVAHKKLLIGLLLTLEDELFALEERLGEGADPAAMAEAEALLEGKLGVRRSASEGESVEEKRAALCALLARPLRVCGMVPNVGEPGGGPYWVRGEHGLSCQIVEGAELDTGDAHVARLVASATHFNPVDLVCGLRDRSGQRRALARFVDQDAVFVSKKSSGGRPLLALERPGLWNGAMAHWNTAFVEVPLETFAPVKTVFDLLRPEHQWGSAEGAAC